MLHNSFKDASAIPIPVPRGSLYTISTVVFMSESCLSIFSVCIHKVTKKKKSGVLGLFVCLFLMRYKPSKNFQT